jgi:membrane-bound lytic murein transglycosylase D
VTTLTLSCIVLGAGAARAEGGEGQAPATLEDFLGEFDPGVLTNLDLSAISKATGLDESQLDILRRNLQEALQGEYVIEVEPLRTAATAAMSYLDKPYADWIAAWLAATEDVSQAKLVIPAPDLALPTKVTPPSAPPAGTLTLAPVVPLPDPMITAKPWHLWPARARPFVPRLKSIFAAEGVPAELVWIAEVESRFNPKAFSRVGAAGLFQLMPETAFLMGLRTKPHDERLDPDKSARACAEYLKYLYGKFRDWPLAIAAYNGGEGRVRRLLTETSATRFDQIAPRLPSETRNYVPKVEATLLLHEGLSLGELKPVW